MSRTLTFLLTLKESMRDLDERIRMASIFIASKDLEDRHRDVDGWEVIEKPDESSIIGARDGRTEVFARVRTMSLRGRGSFGSRQHDSMKKNLKRIEEEDAQYKYLYLLDPGTADAVKVEFPSSGVSIIPLLSSDLIAAVKMTVGGKGAPATARIEPMLQMVEEIVTKESGTPDERIVISPISTTSVRQGFLYIPKDKGHLLNEGVIKIWIRKDASLESKCMISNTGGVRIGGGLTKWFRSMGLSANDELILGSQEDGSLLVLKIMRAVPYQ
ncbi:MAG: hypothetical protein KAH57_04660 [Thermoplasmata archaeon]|nr:hypothetical protein [Thermoplasmata archaeon]